MALPSKKRPKSEKRNRRAANRLAKISHSFCPKCSKPVLSHHLCSFCGTYKAKEFIKKIKTPKKKNVEDKK